MFTKFKVAVDRQLQNMQSQRTLFKVSDDCLWDLYLGSFPKGTNPMFRERTEHDCSCCRNFIRDAGSIVSINHGTYELESIWDIDVGGHYQVVADALSEEVRSRPIRSIFLHYCATLGTDFNHEMLADGTVKQWDHFYARLGSQFVEKKSLGSKIGVSQSGFQVFRRAMRELTLDSIDIALELVNQNSLYRGQEHLNGLEIFRSVRAEYDQMRAEVQDNFCWHKATLHPYLAGFKNMAIGTFLTDLSNGVELEHAVRLYESKVAPANYKRSSAPITQNMVKRAQEKAQELGIVPALTRRHARMTDITVNNVLFASRAARSVMDPFDQLAAKVPNKPKVLKRVQEVPVEEFLTSVLPGAGKVEVMTERRHKGNFMSLIAPVDPDAKPILKWGNNFSWAYVSDVTDSIRENVKRHGGNVEGFMRFSIQWNDDSASPNFNDYDAHALEPGGRLIYYPIAGHKQPSSGILDVDIRTPRVGEPAVENIVWSRPDRMPEGDYSFKVHCYSHRGGRDGFSAEVELDRQVYHFDYRRDLPPSRTVQVAKIRYSRQTGLKIVDSIDQTHSTQSFQGVSTNVFTPVSAIMFSPNYWNGEGVGNKHVFFILEGCRNEEPVRGFFNEFLRSDLTEHRKVFEMLGHKMKVQPAQDQLSGLGFSTTRRDHLTVRVTGKSVRTLKVLF